MIKINGQAKLVMDKLTLGLDAPGDNRVINNARGSFLAVHVEHIGECPHGPLFSVAHYYEQNGDLMKDPDMVFACDQDQEYYPVEFPQDNLGLYQCAAQWKEGGKIKGVNLKLQQDLAKFAATWTRNIREQHGLSPLVELKVKAADLVKLR